MFDLYFKFRAFMLRKIVYIVLNAYADFDGINDIMNYWRKKIIGFGII